MQKSISGNGHAAPDAPKKYRLGLKLTALFLGTLLALAFFGLVYDVFATYAEGKVEELAAGHPPPVVIDPKLKTELNQVMSYDSVPDNVSISDPFIDHAGLSGTVKTSSGTVGTQQASAVAKGPAAANPARTTSTMVARSNSSGSSMSPVRTEPEISAAEATKARLIDFMEKTRMGVDAGPESYIFAIDDLLPVGVVSGGSGQQEIIFFSQVANRTFSYPVGTRFFDGWLTEVRPEGVIFTADDQTRTSRLKSWGRSIKARAGATMSASAPGNSQLADTGN